MTEPAALLARLREQALVVAVVAGPPERLSVQAPKGRLTPALQEEVRANKDALVALLKSEAATPPPVAERTAIPGPCYCCGTTRFWSAGHDHWICGTCHPPAPGVLREGVQWRDGRPSDTTR